MKVLCFVEPWSQELFKVMCNEINPDANILEMSLYKKYDKSGLVQAYYANVKNYKIDWVSKFDEEDLIKRCRLLRSLTPELASCHLVSMEKAMFDIFDKFSPDLVVSETVDSFVLDMLLHVARYRKVKFVGLIPSFVNGYCRVTERGEGHHLRVPGSDEVENITEELLRKEYRPNFIDKSKRRPAASVINRWFRNLFKPTYHYVVRHLTGEKYNNHYWGGQIVASQCMHMLPKLSLGEDDWRSKLASQGKPVIYLPLQHVPEATVDYWCEDLERIEYETVIKGVIETLSTDFHFVVKEHPNVLGFRNPSLYHTLLGMRDVTFCPTYEDSNLVMDHASAVLVWTGSVGFEAALRGVPVISLCNAYYMNAEKYFYILPKNYQVKDVLEFVTNFSSESLTVDDKRDMVRHLLSGLIRGRFKSDGSWSLNSETDVAEAKKIGMSLKAHFL